MSCICVLFSLHLSPLEPPYHLMLIVLRNRHELAVAIRGSRQPASPYPFTKDIEINPVSQLAP